MEKLKSVGASLLLILFTAAWVFIGLRLIAFTPAPGFIKLSLPEAQVTVAGLLAAAVGAGTASVLGIEIAKQNNTQTVATQATGAINTNPLLGIGVLIYALVGCFVLGVFWFRSESTPDFVAAFALTQRGNCQTSTWVLWSNFREIVVPSFLGFLFFGPRFFPVCCICAAILMLDSYVNSN